jgi:hypothetical protein
VTPILTHPLMLLITSVQCWRWPTKSLEKRWLRQVLEHLEEFKLDYGMVVRMTLVYYALKRLGLDADPAARKPQDQQIFLLSDPEMVHGSNSNNGRIG